jgi:hypothetical protein
MSSDEYARRVAERLMGQTRIRCIDCASAYRFVATCPHCGVERLLTTAERDARSMYCCERLVRLLPYDKRSGLEIQQGLKNHMRREGIPGWDRVISWEEHAERGWEFAKRMAEMHK